MVGRLAAALLLASGAGGCISYEYDHELWLRLDGSGTVNVTGRPGLWAAFKGLGRPDDLDRTVTRESVRALFEASGLRVRRVTLTRREGQPYLFVSADFDDVNALAGRAAFPDLTISLRRSGDRFVLSGGWRQPAGAPEPPAGDRDGLMAVRFHLPSKVYDHKNAAEGVERGNIVSWRQDVAQALDGAGLEFGATLDDRSILGSTVLLFGSVLFFGLGAVALLLYLAFRKGRRELASGEP